ncbi:GNAT family N-acetyltransferase [Candidatus Woesebacteria bacterium]|nr:GNAT family N-acetyltransferase [Candidatus Woesebacteria bacterium]
MKLRKYLDTDARRVVDLLNLCFPQKKITVDTFLWKHFDVFFQKRSVCYVAEDNQLMCSFVCFTPMDIQHHHTTRRFYSCAVQATHPEYRRQGWVTQLTQLVEKELGVNTEYIGFSNSDGVKIDRNSKKINYDIVGQLYTRYVPSLPYISTIQIVKTDTPEISLLDCPYLSVHKPKAYISWRYGRNEKGHYEYFSVSKNNQPIGSLICRTKKHRYEVKELLISSFHQDDYNEVIKAFASYSLFHGKFLVSYTYLKSSFWQHVFPIVSRVRTIPIFLTVKSTDLETKNPDNWFIQGGDIQ